MWSTIVSFLPRAIAQGIPLLYGSTGEIVTQKSGNMNLGIPGVMYVGGICGVIGAFLYEQSLPSPGLAMTTFGVGFGNFFGGSLVKLTGADMPFLALSATSNCFKKTLPFAEKLGVAGQLLFGYGFLVYLAIAIAIVAAFIIKRTRVGLHLRAVGENPATADSAGINVNRYKYVATCIGCMIAGLGGLYYVMDYAGGIWANDAFGDRGWLAIALVIFTLWRSDIAVLASFLFGGLYLLNLYIPSGMNLAVKELYKMLPYVVTIIVLVISSLRNQRDKQPPQSLGLPYFREDR